MKNTVVWFSSEEALYEFFDMFGKYIILLERYDLTLGDRPVLAAIVALR